MAHVTGAFLISVASLVLVLVHALVQTPIPVHLRIVAALPGVAALVLWSRYFFVAREHDRFPFLEYAVTQFYLYWGLAVVTLKSGDMPPLGEHAWRGAVIASCVVTAAVLFAHPTGGRLGARLARTLDRLLPPTAPPLSPAVVLPWLGIAAAIHAHAGTGIIPPSVYHLVTVLGDYSPLLAALAWRDLREGRPSLPFVACTATLSFAGLLTGMMEAVIQPVLTAITLYAVFRRRIPWRLVAAGALLVVVLNPAKHHYREMAWANTDSPELHVAKDPLLTAQRWWKALQMAWVSDQSDHSANAAGLASRLNELTTNAVVLERTSVSIPFDHGRNWGYIAVSPVPRFLYPEKPNFTRIYNDRFSITFGFQTPEGTETSTAAYPLVADGYWNFGWPGVLFVGAVTGVMIGFFSGALRARSWAMAAIAVSMFVNLHATGCLGVQVMGVFQRVAGLTAVLWVSWLASCTVQRMLTSQSPGRVLAPSRR